jgi:AcrR family transcriptional regulator
MIKRSIKERTLTVAKEKFLKHGFYKISMDSLVKELRTSKSSVYNHYSSKDELVKAVIDQLNIDINSSLETIINDDKLSFKGKLIGVAEFTKNLLASISEEFLKDLEINTPEIWDYYQESRIQRINKYYRALFEKGINEGLIRADINIKIVLAIYLNLMELPLKKEYLNYLDINNEIIYENVTEVFLNGILVK